MRFLHYINFILALTTSFLQPCLAEEATPLNQLKQAYPDFIKHTNQDSLEWIDGSHINITDKPYRTTRKSPSLIDQINQPPYPSNQKIDCNTFLPYTDSGRIRNEAFFAKMYGDNEADVRKNLDMIYWMPVFFGHRYPLLISRVNGVNIKLKNISAQLELLVMAHPDYLKYLYKPSGTFYWRHIQNSNRRSPHSFGMAIDINSNYANYWIWDTNIENNSIHQEDVVPYKNDIPCEIVSIFENNGFIWGGKWEHYDTMHFEYRPELLIP